MDALIHGTLTLGNRIMIEYWKAAKTGKNPRAIIIGESNCKTTFKIVPRTTPKTIKKIFQYLLFLLQQ